MIDQDRTVHAHGPDGAEIVRYDKAGKWWLERPGGTRTRLALFTAATEASLPGWTPTYGRPGGSRFDTEVRNLIRTRLARERRAAV